MKTAKELYEISKEQAPLLVKAVLDGVKEQSIERCGKFIEKHEETDRQRYVR